MIKGQILQAQDPEGSTSPILIKPGIRLPDSFKKDLTDFCFLCLQNLSKDV